MEEEEEEDGGSGGVEVQQLETEVNEPKQFQSTFCKNALWLSGCQELGDFSALRTHESD